ncbi:GlsB/YeaQ/YmgE family stress response membrane protein [Nostoc sp. B(2019)]|nr:GlsB/YeaQ/YmgE family stress response membrane protein [Nostoc sp. B(2019)]
MNIIVWVVLGLLAGAIAKAVYPGYQGGGMLSTMILGIVGAFIGGSLLTLLQTGTLQLTAAGSGLSITGILVAVLGAIIAIYIWGLLRRSSNA